MGLAQELGKNEGKRDLHLFARTIGIASTISNTQGSEPGRGYSEDHPRTGQAVSREILGVKIILVSECGADV